MRDYEYLRADDVRDAVSTLAQRPEGLFLAGGTNLVDHLKLGVAAPEAVVDVSHLPLDAVEESDGGLRVGANVRNSDLAAHPRVRRDYAVLSRALLAGASGQIRNQATTGGNLLQRTRCVYFQDVSTPCNKREPGSGCSAIGGYDRYNAVLGASEHCVAVHPSDMAVGMAVLDGTAVVLGPDGERRVALADLHRLPGSEPQRDSTLQHGELITAIDLPALPTGARSTYYKARDRASYAFALVSCAAVLQMDQGVVREVRLAWGGIAHKPWRASRAEEALVGSALSPDDVRAAVDAELAPASTSEGNAYKLAMIRNVTTLVLHQLSDPTSQEAGR